MESKLNQNSVWNKLTVLALVACLGVGPVAQINASGIGIAYVDIPQGFSLISNPFSTGSNTVAEIFGDILVDGAPGELPVGFELIKYNGITWSTNVYAGGGVWSDPNMTLTPGEGAIASSPSALTWIAIGKPVTGMLQNFIPAGDSLRSSILPQDGLLTTDLEFPGVEGVKVSTVDAASGAFTEIATYTGGAWQPSEPTLAIGESFYFESPQAVSWDRDFDLEGVENPLQITAQPQGVTVDEGQAFSLTVQATGATDLQYQWQFNGSDIAGANAASFDVASAQSGDAGSYGVVVFNAQYSIRSDQAVVTVNQAQGPLEITQQPQDQSVGEGDTITLSVGATGPDPITYQWQKDGEDLAGATEATLTIENATTDNAGSYVVVVSSGDASVSSDPATVTVTMPGGEDPFSIAIAIADTQLELTITGEVGQIYDLSRGTAVDDFRPWAAGEGIVNETGTVVVTDTFRTSRAAFFYLVSLRPAN